MNNDRRLDTSTEHESISGLLPWYVNATLDDADRQRVESHLRLCDQCRTALAQERVLYQHMRADAGIEHMPAASLQRLMSRLDEIPEREVAAGSFGVGLMADAASPRQPVRWNGLIAASVAVMTLAMGLLAAGHWPLWGRQPAASYYTVTNAAPRAPNEVIRAVFSPDITLVELQGILDEAQLRIVSGPTEAGVYSLAAKSSRPVTSSLALLRGHDKVRFAESTRPEAKPEEHR